MSRLLSFFVFFLLFLSTVSASTLVDMDSSFELEAWPQPEAVEAPMADLLLKHQEHMFANTLTGGVDPCASENPCQNNGTCFTLSTVGAGMYTCYCTDGWQGTNCTIATANATLLVFESPFDGLYTGVQGQAAPISLNGTKLIQGGVDAGNIIRLNLRSLARNTDIFVSDPFNASVVRFLQFNTTVTIDATLSIVNSLLNSIIVTDSDVTTAAAFPVLYIEATEFNGSVSTGLGAALRSTNITLSLKLVAGTPGYQGIQLVSTSSAIAVIENNPVSFGDLGFDIVNFDIINNLKVDSVSVRVTAINGSIAYQTGSPPQYFGFIFSTGRLADMRNYLKSALYRPNPAFTQDTLTFILSDSLNTTTYVVPVSVSLTNRAPVLTRLSTVVASTFDDQVINLAGWTVTDVDSNANSQFTTTATALFGQLNIVNSTEANNQTIGGVSSLADLGVLLRNIRYFPTYGAVGRDNITVCVTDDGANLPGGAKTTCSTVSVNVNLRIIAPLVPTIPTVVSFNATWALLRWGPALTSDPHYGNSSLYSYELQILRYTNSSSILSFGTVFNGVATSFNVTGLVPNSVYLVQLRASNQANSSAFTTQTIIDPDTFTGVPAQCSNNVCSGFRTDLTAPTPIVPAATVLSSSSVRLSWNPPADNGGVALSSYIVYYRAQNYRPEGNGAIVTGVCTLNTTSCLGSFSVSPSTLTATVTGLQALMPYWFAVSAVNTVGYSSDYSVISGILRTGITTLATAPAITSFTVVDTVNANTANYHVGNAFRFTFDVGTTTPLITNGSWITYSQAVGTISYTWLSATVLQGVVTSVPAGVNPQIGVLTATISAAANIQRSAAASAPVAATTNPVTGAFGVIANAPTISNIGFNATGYPTGVPILFRFNVIASDNTVYNMTVATSNPAGSTIRYVPLSNNYTFPATAGIASASTVNGLSTINFYGTAQFLTLFANNGLYYTAGGFAAATGSLIVSVSTSAGVVLASTSANIRLLATNAPPTMTVNSRNTTLPVGIAAPLGVAFTITDTDADNFPANPVRATLQIVAGSITVSTNATVVSTSSDRVVTITGPFALVVSALNSLVITNDIPAMNNGVNTLLVTFDDLNNGNFVPGTTIRPGLATSVSISIFSDCASSVNNIFTPTAYLFDNLGGFYVPLDGYIGPGVLPANIFECTDVFASTTSFGTGAECGIFTADNPLAALYTGSVVYVKFGTGATAVINNTVTSVAGNSQLRRCRTATPDSRVSTATISAPLNVVAPAFTLQGPSSVSFCPGATAQYSVVPISGFGGRDIASYSWSATGLNSTTDSSFVVISDVINAGGNITLSVTVSNWGGGRATRTITVARANVPAVTLTGPSQRSVTRDTTFILDFIVSLPSCLNTTAPAVVHQWIVSPSTGLDASTSSSPALRVLGNTLAFNTVYTYTLTSRLNGSSTTTTAQVVVSVADRPLVARIDGGNYRTVATNAVNTFQTTTSSIPISSPTIVYAWTCLDAFGFACVDSTSNAVFPVFTTSSIGIPANSQAPGIYHWTVKLTANNGVSSTFSTTVEITVATATPVPVRLSFSPSVLNTDSVLRITPSLPSAASNYLFQWSYNNGALPALTATQQRSTVLVLNQAGASFFVAGTSYTFRLRVSSKADPTNSVSIAEISLVCNNPPSGGSFSVSPSTGVASTTNFRFTASNWKDLDNHEPLTYQYIITSQDGSPVFLSGPTISSTWETALPPGSTVTNNQLNVAVLITDNVGGESISFSTVTVTPPVVTPSASEIVQTNFYAIANVSTEASKIVASASVTGILLNTLTPTTEDQSALRLPILNSITPLLAQTPVRLSLQAITNLISSTHTPSRAMLQKAVDMLNTLLSLIGSDPSAAQDRADILSYQQLYQNILSQ